MKEFVRSLFRHPRMRLVRNFVRPYFVSGLGSEQWLRIVMDQATSKMVAALNPSSLKTLEISGKDWARRHTFREFRSVDFPEFDICSQTLDETFDLIIAEQVFEHLLWPYRAGKNVYSMLRPGGWFLISTPFLLRVHDFPTDCSRWTEIGTKHFLAECGFPLESIQTGSWGNRACARAHLNRKWWIYVPWMHSLRNEPDFPAVVWALAQKQ